MLPRIVLTGFALTALAVTACSGGGGGGGGSATPTLTPSPTPTPAAATISKTASTNTQAYTIVVQQNGSATITEGSGSPTSGTVPSATASQFFSDLNANTPVTNIQTYAPCTKSASFGTSTTVSYEGYTTGDISCPAPSSPAPVTTIYNDVQNVETALGVASS